MKLNRDIFKSRREFFRISIGFIMKAGSVAGLLMTGVTSAAAKIKKRLLPADTDPRRLFNDDPKYLDTRNLEITPIVKFDTMGDTEVDVDLGKWRLEVTGDVLNPIQLSYDDLLKLPSIKRKVLLICPGVFSYHAEYTGISLETLLAMSEAAKDASRIAFYGRGELVVGKKERFRIDDMEGDKLFLAYAVNSQPLPQRHGFPLRVVAEEHDGDRWVKYVYKIRVDR